MREYTDEEMKTILRSVNCGYGPERTDFTMKDPAGYITFNSIIDNPGVGNERNFVRVKEYNSEKPFENQETNIDDALKKTEKLLFCLWKQMATAVTRIAITISVITCGAEKCAYPTPSGRS